MEPLKIGVLLSGSGTNLQAIIDAVRDDGLPVDIVKVISSRPDAYGVERAREAGIPAVALNRDVYADPLAADARSCARRARSTWRWRATCASSRP